MKIVTIIGARPQFIKVAPVSRAIEAYNKRARDSQLSIQEIVVHTGQHYDYDMSQVFFDELGITKPDYNLDVRSGTHGKTTGKMLAGIEQVLVEEKPDRVLIYGDTNSTLAGALAAVKLHIPIAHVEAGLRSFNRRMPEEINRVLADHVADLFFCPTQLAVRNLENEGITEGVFNVGDVMFDAFLMNKERAEKRSRILEKLDLQEQNFCLATLHRQENTDVPQRLANIFEAFQTLAKKGQRIVIPLHPRTRKVLENCPGFDEFHSNLKIIPPLSYLDFVSLESKSKIIFTDSGGIQKEAFFAGVPCITLREETEWVETVEAGANFLAGASPKRIESCFQKAFHFRPSGTHKPYGHGNAARLIVDCLIEACNTDRN